MAKTPKRDAVPALVDPTDLAAVAASTPAAPAVEPDDGDVAAPEAAKPVSIDTTEPPYIVGGKRVAKLTVAPINFVAHAAILASAGLRAASEAGDDTDVARIAAYGKLVTRERLLRRLKAWDENGNPVPLNAGDIRNMPRAYAGRAIAAVQTVDAGEPGEVISEGNGVDSPVLYRFGTPLKMASGKGEALQIEEVEFIARTLGDIEDVLAADNPFSQAVLLIQNCAKPVGGPVPLQRLPSWAVEQVLIADGAKIAQEVLPRFLE